MAKRKLPPFSPTKHLADYMQETSGELTTALMMFWAKCGEGTIKKSELSELLLRLQQAGRELNSAIDLCEGLEKISRFKIENQN